VRQGDFTGFINPAGEFVIEPQFYDAGDFSEGLAGVLVRDEDAPRGVSWGFVDPAGTIAIEPQFIYDGSSPAPTFRRGLAAVWLADGLAYVNRQGEIVRGPAQ
jgi:hypothetical protein